MNINELAKQIEALTPEDALSLFDSIVGLQERAAKMREEKVAAERERDERYPTCSCGKPATHAGFFQYMSVAIEPGVKRKNGELRGGIVFAGDSDYNDPHEQADLTSIDKAIWVSCESCGQDWKRIDNGFDLKVGERW